MSYSRCINSDGIRSNVYTFWGGSAGHRFGRAPVKRYQLLHLMYPESFVEGGATHTFRFDLVQKINRAGDYSGVPEYERLSDADKQRIADSFQRFEKDVHAKFGPARTDLK